MTLEPPDLNAPVKVRSITINHPDGITEIVRRLATYGSSIDTPDPADEAVTATRVALAEKTPGDNRG